MIVFRIGMKKEIYQELLKIIETLSKQRDISHDGILEMPFYYFEFDPNSTNKE